MATTVMMIHGMMGGAWCWDQYKPYFEARGYRCLTPVLQYHDMDPRDTPDPELGQTGLLDYAADLEEEIRKLDSPPILVGHSMGGLLAQMLGTRGLARALVLITPAPPFGINALKTSVLRCFDPSLIRWKIWEQPFSISYPKSVYAMSHLLPVNERKKIYSQLVYESGLATFQMGFWFLDFHPGVQGGRGKSYLPGAGNRGGRGQNYTGRSGASGGGEIQECKYLS